MPLALSALALALAAPFPALSQAYPSKPIELVVHGDFPHHRGMAIESALRGSDWWFRKSAVRLAEQSERLAGRVGTLQARAIVALADPMTQRRWRLPSET